MFSDAYVVGHITEGLGPYSLLNTIPLFNNSGAVGIPMVARIAWHLEQSSPDLSKTDDALYHGGRSIDELAALISLALGARIYAGDISREFRDWTDELGWPRSWEHNHPPTILFRGRKRVLPSVTGQKNLDEVQGLLASIVRVESSKFVGLVRSARLYEHALWLAESQPNLAWLMLVSALETAAVTEKIAEATPSQRLEDSKPNLVKILREAGDEQLVNKVASEIADSLGATTKFTKFTLRFLPPEPSNRPPEGFMQIPWSKRALREILSKVYSYRSVALHSGLPFPAPMLDSPCYLSSPDIPAERPLVGRACSQLGGTWNADDVPINLHAFHYIVRGALLNWWKSIAGDPIVGVSAN